MQEENFYTEKIQNREEQEKTGIPVFARK